MRSSMKKYIIIISSVVLLSGCSVYKNYTRAEDIKTDSLYGVISHHSDSANLGELSWRELFTDTLLQQLIEQGLENNTDLRIAHLRVEQAEAALSVARLAFLPSLSFSPQGGTGSFGGVGTGQTYSLPVSASWQIDVFGKLRNAKERSKSLVESSYEYQKAVRTELVASIATRYYTLSMLREQLYISEQTSLNWAETVRAMKVLMEAGQYNDAAVSQAEASYNRSMASTIELKQQITEMGNSISVLLGDAIHRVETNGMDRWETPRTFEIGIPLNLLSQRPDVMHAEHNLAAAFYTTGEVRAAFYPTITLGGSVGWTNLAGVVTNPGKLLVEALGSLTQPIFGNGRLKAQLRVAKAGQEEAKLIFGQTLLDAGMEVNNAYTQVITYQEQSVYYKNQVAASERATKATRLLMEGGSSGYLEVLTAQDNLHAARLSLVVNRYNEIASFISLYQALGGGSN